MKTTFKPTIYVNSFELARHLTEKFERYVEIGDSANDTDYSVTLEAQTEFAEYDQKTIDKFLKTGWISMDHGYRTILNYACGLGYIEPGDWVIQVSW